MHNASRKNHARRVLANAARCIRQQWSPLERHARANAADAMQMRLLHLLGLRPVLAPRPSGQAAGVLRRSQANMSWGHLEAN